MKIGIVSPYPEFSALAQEVAAELNIDARVEEGVLDHGVEIARRWEAEGAVDAVVARGPTAIMIRKAVSLPVTIIEITGYDMLEALYRARQIGGKVAVIDYAHRVPQYDMQLLGRIACVEFTPLLYRNNLGLVRQVLTAAREGYETIVGTGVCIARMAQERNMHGVLVHTSRETLYDALRHTVAKLRLAEQQRARSRRTRAVLDLTSDGILATDHEGAVLVFNRAAERLLGLSAREVLGKTREALADHPVLGPMLGELTEARAELVKAGGLNLVINRLHQGEQNLVVTFQAASQIQILEEKIRKQLHTKGLVARYSFADLIGRNPLYQRTLERAGQFAATDLTVLLTGESGTGKELFAHAIHRASRRSVGPFVAVNCAALPENLLESELFGYEEGAFTGARKGGKMGLFELAHGGTIFLDEIGELSVTLQARLLRVLQGREVMRVGGDRLIPVDVRVVAATNRNLQEAVQEGRFRQDLYYRLNVLNLRLPSLRERLDDVPLLAKHFLEEYSEAAGVRFSLPDSALRLLSEHDWPGNVRELENFIQKFAVLSLHHPNPAALVRELLDELRYGRAEEGEGLRGNTITIEVGTMEEMEQQILQQLDRRAGLDRAQLARFLGISRTTLWKKLKETAMEH
ncbi:MAG: sigma 54-interacting transcriptional regulator [Bacillota bacterium]